MSDETPEEEMPEEGTAMYLQLPPEVRAYFDHQRMHAEQNAHETVAFIESLNEEQLRRFRGILGVISGNEGAVPYYLGLIGGFLSQKFDICLACGNNHDKTLEDMAAPPDHDPILMKDEEQSESNMDLSDRKIAMHEYSVEPLVDDDYTGQVLCVGPCEGAQGHATWANIEARMEQPKGPAGCNFCQQKEAWG